MHYDCISEDTPDPDALCTCAGVSQQYLRAGDGGRDRMARRYSFGHFLTNLDQPMPLPEKVGKLTRNLWRRVVLRQTCCGHHGEPGC